MFWFLKVFTFQYGQIYYFPFCHFLVLNYFIYIPIWLDLLCLLLTDLRLSNCHLHSNMVRFIIEKTTQYKEELQTIYIPIWLDLLFTVCPFLSYSAFIFTFQYGQIYYYESHRILQRILQDLHSNMVRFIIFYFVIGKAWIYCIYIPIWLDLLFKWNPSDISVTRPFTFQYGQIYYLFVLRFFFLVRYHLHSNMVRFIIDMKFPSSIL